MLHGTGCGSPARPSFQWARQVASRRQRWIVVARFHLVLAAFALQACTVEPISEPLTVAGTYQGDTPGGAPILLTLEQDGQAFRGHGNIGGEPVAIAGPLTWTAVATMTHANGATTTHTVALEADGDTLRIEAPGQEPILLMRGGTASGPPPGAFSGTYAGVGDAAPFVRATLVQSGDLFSGTGVILGLPAGLGGRITEPGKAEGTATLPDQSQISFGLELSQDQRTLLLLGVADPITLRRQ